MRIDKRGITRTVFIFRKFVIKIPKSKYEHSHFLQGCYANWSERKYYKTFSKADYEENMVKWVIPSYWCSWFGLFQVQAKAEPLLRNLTPVEIEFYKPLCGTDFKKENFGWYQGRVVCLDYP